MHKEPIAIEVSHLKKAYKNVPVLGDVTFNVPRGSIFALLGANGAGKTTTINILTTLTRADGGSAKIDGLDVVHDAAKVRDRISLTGQFAAVDDMLSGEENMVLIGELRHIKRPEETARLLLGEFGLSDASSRRAITYSGGMRRRLDIAMSMIGKPSVVFLDEPTTGLDPQSRSLMWEKIRTLRGKGITVFLTTQYLEEADQLADSIAVLSQGRVVAQGSAEELKKLLPQGRIELRFTTGTQLNAAAKLLDKLSVIRNESDNSLTVTTDGSVAHLTKILNQLEEARLEVAEFSQKTPTLDEAFLRIINEHEER